MRKIMIGVSSALLMVQAGCDSHRPVEPDLTGPSVATTLVAIPSGTTANTGAEVLKAPSVQVRDQRGMGMGGILVSFAVTSGGGTVVGESATTGADGIASVVSWTLGTTPGQNTLTASVAGLPSVTFVATGSARVFPCSTLELTPVFGTTIGSLTVNSCKSDGVFLDSYSLRLTLPGAYLFRMSGSFDTYLWLLGRDGFAADNHHESSTSSASAIKALLPAGTYELLATSWTFGATGTYSLSSAIISEEVNGCEEVYVVRGVTTSQSIQTTDCRRANAPTYGDEFRMYVAAGQPVTISMVSTTIDSFLEVFREDATTGARTSVGSNDNADASGAKDARVSFTATVNSYYVIQASTSVGGQTGSYTLTIR